MSDFLKKPGAGSPPAPSAFPTGADAFLSFSLGGLTPSSRGTATDSGATGVSAGSACGSPRARFADGGFGRQGQSGDL